MIGNPAPVWKLSLALVLPSAAVGAGLFGARDVRFAFALYLIVGCGLGPWLLLGARPLSTGIGLPWSIETFRRLGWHRFAAWLAFGPVFFVAYARLRHYVGDPEQYLSRLGGLGWRPEHEVLYALLFVTLIPLAEEWWWRGQALPRCVRRFGRWRGILLAASSYAGYHAFTLAALYDGRSTSIRLAAILAAGVVWSVLALRRGEWGITYFAHLGADMAIVAAFFLYVR